MQQRSFIYPEDKQSNKKLSNKYKNDYEIWKSISLENNGFFTIFNGFTENNILKNISGNALKLYVFFGIHSKNMTGESYYSIKTIANYFNKSERTISNWIKELEDMNLIRRLQLEPNNVSHTYLIPYYSGKKRNDIDE